MSPRATLVGLTLAVAAALPAAEPASGTPPRQVRPPAPNGTPRAGVDPDTTEAGWDGPRVRDLVASAVARRRTGYSDSTLHGFRARARGHVYYLARVGDGDAEPRLVRADQVALRVRWQAPDRSLQTLVGRRSERRLPTRIRYHIDHLSLILGNFGDRIRLGEGTEVRDVPHPVAPGALTFYEFRLADSLQIRTPRQATRIYRLEVRPRDPERAGVVGELWLTRASRAVARMRFTFTPSAYRDPTVRSIDVDLQSALWEGRYWLPAEQRVTVRRGLSWMDVPLAGIIRTRLRVSGYEINPEEGLRLADGHRVVSLPRDRLEAFGAWEEGLYEGPRGEATAAEVDPDQLRRRARRMVRGRILGGGSRLAPRLADVSSTIRARRSEGLLFGAGGRYRLDDARRLEAWAGHPAEAGGVEWRATYRGPPPGVEAGAEADAPPALTVDAYGDRLSDAGPFAASAGVVASLGFLLRGDDLSDPYFRDGVRLRGELPAGPGRLFLGLRHEVHRPATLAALSPGGSTRPVRRVTAGELNAARLGFRWARGEALGGHWQARLSLEGALHRIGDFGFSRALLRFRGASAPDPSGWSWTVEGGLGAGQGELPPQRLLLLGGRGTVPGYAFRGWGGDRAGFLRLEVTREVAGPWVRLRGLAAAGWAELTGPGSGAGGRMGVGGSDGLRPSAGLGVGFVDGWVRVDLARGLDDGGWEWMVSVNPDLWPML